MQDQDVDSEETAGAGMGVDRVFEVIGSRFKICWNRLSRDRDKAEFRK